MQNVKRDGNKGETDKRKTKAVKEREDIGLTYDFV